MPTATAPLDRPHPPPAPPEHAAATAATLDLLYLHYLYGDDTARHHVRQFTAAARRLGHRVDVHAMNLAPAEDPAAGPAGLAGRTRGALKRRFSRYLHEPKELLWNLRYVRRETRLAAAARPDLLLVRDALLIASCVPVARRLGLPLVVELNSPAAESRLYLDEYLHLPRLPEWIEGWKLRRADAVVVVSSALERYIVERYGVDPARVVVAPNGADTARFRPDVERDPELAPALAGSPVVGFVGSFQKWHGSELLGRMLTAVGTARPAARFLLVGDGPEAGAVRRAAAPLGDRLAFTGRVAHDRVPGLVACFDVGVMPESNFYGSPLKVIEWMAAGRAVVAPRYGPLEELIDDGVHGLLFPPGDAEALAAAVVRLIDRPDLARELGRAAAARARAELSWEHNAARVVAACRQALERRRAGGRGPGG